MQLDPLHQLKINNLFTIGHIGGYTIAFTNSSAYMLLAVTVTSLLRGARRHVRLIWINGDGCVLRKLQ
jgi:hypothetical protein